MRTAFLPPLASLGEGAERRFFLGLARGDLRRAIGCYGSKPWCRAEDQSIPPHGHRQPGARTEHMGGSAARALLHRPPIRHREYKGKSNKIVAQKDFFWYIYPISL